MFKVAVFTPIELVGGAKRNVSVVVPLTATDEAGALTIEKSPALPAKEATILLKVAFPVFRRVTITSVI